jgi:hypothetical protein
VVFVMGAGHCGSTLLDLLLGSHSRGFSLGEVRAIGKLAMRGFDPPRLCGICQESCAFWNGRVPGAWARHHFDAGRRRADRLRHRLAPFLSSFYRPLFQASGARVLVDSSKTPGWIERQLRPRHFWLGVRPFLIYMVRDGRAVANSYLRKYPEAGMDAWAREWVERTRQMNRYFDRFPPGSRMIVRYERLASDPAEVLREICGRLGLAFEPEMLRYWTHEHHTVGGNLGTRSLIFRWRKQFEEATLDGKFLSQRHADYLRQVGLAIKLDERWRSELSEERVERFETIAGALNQPFAYGDDRLPVRG